MEIHWWKTSFLQTLDTTTRELFLMPKRKWLMIDTIGFISNIPHGLIEAFKSTLDELKFSELLIHVIDLSNSAWRDQVRIVNETLAEIGVQKRTIYAFNKIDSLDKEKLICPKTRNKFFGPPPLCVYEHKRKYWTG